MLVAASFFAGKSFLLKKKHPKNDFSYVFAGERVSGPQNLTRFIT